MTDIEYRIGGLSIDRTHFRERKSSQYDPHHRFVVEGKSEVVTIYISKKLSHELVAEQFDLRNPDVFGGGFCYLNENDVLTLEGESGVFGVIPKEVAQYFARLLKPKIEELGFEVRRLSANPETPMCRNLDPYWNQFGFYPIEFE